MPTYTRPSPLDCHHLEDILAMARVYNKPELCNIYCSQICLLGQEYIPSIECKDLSQITLEMMPRAAMPRSPGSPMRSDLLRINISVERL